MRSRARQRVSEDAALYSAQELAEIESLYRSAHYPTREPVVPKPDGADILRALVAKYPRSNRAGCAILRLARLAHNASKEALLREAMTQHADAWYEDGVQVGAMARAQLAIYFAGIARFDEAESLAQELIIVFPGAVDHSGASLDDTLAAIQLLTPPR